jgi:hypothetical protein
LNNGKEGAKKHSTQQQEAAKKAEKQSSGQIDA